MAERKFLVLAGDEYYPSGYEDIRGCYPTLEAAMKVITENYDKWACEWIEVYNLEAMLLDRRAEVVANYSKELHQYVFEPLKWEIL